MRDYIKLLPFLKPHLGLLWLSALCMVASNLLEVISLGAVVPLIDLVILEPQAALPGWIPASLTAAAEGFMGLDRGIRLLWVLGGFAFLYLLKNLVIFAQAVFMDDTALRFLRDVRDGIYRHYHRLSLTALGGGRTGELVSRITHDVSVLQNAITEGITNLVLQSSKIVIFAAVVLSIDWRLALIIAFYVPAIGWPIVRIGRRLRKLGFLSQERMADLNVRIIETLQGGRIIKAFTAERYESERFRRTNRDYYKANIRTVKRREALTGVTELVALIGALVILYLGVQRVLQEAMTPGTLAYFMAALMSLIHPIKKLSRLYSVHQQAVTAARRVMQIFETPEATVEAPRASALRPFEREIRFQEVWFKYDDRFVLQGVDLSVRAGEVVALVGQSGAGKTTLVNLIPRFYDPTRGRVTLDGVDLKSVTLESLRRQIGLVTQDPFLFHDTVRGNIAFGVPETPPEKVEAAARAANADVFIRRLPRGYDTPVGELGFKLSGGERQRIAIARAILKDPPILILDEATSQLDSESEALVQEALERLMRERTVVVIAHRLSTVRRADRIVVLEAGRVAEVGRHDELLTRSFLYRRLYELQVAR